MCQVYFHHNQSEIILITIITISIALPQPSNSASSVSTLFSSSSSSSHALHMTFVVCAMFVPFECIINFRLKCSYCVHTIRLDGCTLNIFQMTKKYNVFSACFSINVAVVEKMSTACFLFHTVCFHPFLSFAK